MADELIATLFAGAGLGIWLLLCYISVGAIVEGRFPRWITCFLIFGTGLALFMMVKAWAFVLFSALFVVTMFQISNGSGKRAYTPAKTTRSGEVSRKGLATSKKAVKNGTNEKMGPITGSHVTEAMLFDGDPIRIKRARRIKKTFGHYPWYLGGDL